MRVIDVHHGTERLAQVRDLVDRRDGPVPGEQPVAHDEYLLRNLICRLQGSLQVAHVAMAVDDPLRLREPVPVDDAPMVQFVRQDGVAFARELRDEARVPREPAHVEEGGLAVLEPRNPPFEFLVEVHVSRDRPDAAAAGPMGLHGLPCGTLHLGMVREVQVVVRAEHDHPLAVHRAARGGWTLEHAQFPIEALRDEALVLRSHPGRRVAAGHRQPSMGKATFPQSPLRITSIASEYLSRGNLCVRIGRRFRLPLRRRPPIWYHVLYMRRPWMPSIETPFVTISERSKVTGFAYRPRTWMPPAGRTIERACAKTCSLPEHSRTSSTPSPDVKCITSSTRPLSDFRTAWAPTAFASLLPYSFRCPMARTRPAPIARHTATAMRPIGPRPKIATVFPGTFAFVVVYTAFPSGSCIVASSGGESGSLRMTFEAGDFTYSGDARARRR